MSGGGPDAPAPERYDRVRALFLAATRLPPEQREAHVERESGGDAALAAEVRALLLSHDDPDDSFVAKSALSAAESLVETPKRIGAYVVRAKIGEGGMGAVFECVQENPRRIVAVKVLHPSVASGATRQRFEREASLLARLHHPGIAQIFESGEAETDLGRQPYFVMERVDGLPVTEYAIRNGLDTAQRLQLFARVCDAVQHAHDRGVVHRDLKPANVLVEPSGQPKVLDFGIARLLAQDERRFTSALTGEDLILGTVPYLSPEQASGRAREIDGRADVYSLGVILYELLTGDLPFDVRARPAAEALRIVLDHDPTPPATRSRELRGDVETILGKAMEKDRDRRYATAAALAADVRRHLRNEPIAARPPSALYRVRKFTRRNRALVAGTVATFAALVAGALVAAKLAFDEHAARERADWNAYRSSVLLAGSALDDGDAVAARAALEGTPERLRSFEWKHLERRLDSSLATFRAAEEPRPVMAVEFSEDGNRLLLGTQGAGVRVVDVDGAAGVASPFDLVGADASVPALGPRAGTYVAVNGGKFELRRAGARDDVVSASAVPFARFERAAISPDGTRVAGWTGGDSFELFDTSGPEWRPLASWQGWLSWRSDAAFSRDGSLLAFCAGGGAVRVVSAASGAERALLGNPTQASGVSFSPDGERLAVGSGPDVASPEGAVSVYDVAAGKLLLRIPFEIGPVFAVEFARDGRHLAVGTAAGAVHVLDAATGKLTAVHRSQGSLVWTLAYSTDGKLLAAGGPDGIVSVFSAETGPEEACVLRGHTSYLYACDVAPDGRTIASGAWDNTVRLWDVASGTETAVLRGHSYYLDGVEFDPSGTRLLSYAADRTCRLWDAASGREIARHAEEGYVHAAIFSADGALLVVAGEGSERSLFTRDARTGEIGTVLRAPSPGIAALAASPVGDFVAAGATDGSVRLHELPSLALLRASPPAGAKVSSVDCSRDGARIVAGLVDGSIESFDAATMGRSWTRHLSGGETFAVRFSPDGERIAVGGRDGRLRLVDARSGEIVASLRGHADYVYDLAWTPDGSAIVTASGDKTLRIWDTAPAGDRLRARLAAERAR